MSEVDLQQLAIDRDPPPPTRRRRHVWTRYVLPGSLLLGFAAVVVWFGRDLVLPPRPVTVVPVLMRAASVQEAGTQLFQASGWIEPRPTAIRVAALAPGVVERMLVVEDQAVEAGETVAELVKDDARLAVRRAKADGDLRQAELEEAIAKLAAATTRFEQPVHLEAQLRSAEAALAKIETQLEDLPHVAKRARIALQFAREDYEGKDAARGVVAEVEIQKALSVRERAESLVAELVAREGSLKKEQLALRQRRDAMQVQLKLLADETEARDSALARVKAARARVAQSEVQTAEAQLWLNRMTITAPVSGRVYQLIGNPGSRVGSGMTQVEGYDGSTIVTLYRPQQLQVRVDVRFDNLPEVQSNQPVRINNAALAAPLTGRVLVISSLADIQKNTLEVKVAIDNPPSLFKPDMLVDVTFLAGGTERLGGGSVSQERFYVPRQLVKSDAAGSFVWLADRSAGVARRVAVETGASAPGGLVQVSGDLAMGSRVIAGGAEGLADGTRIKVTGEEPEAAYSGGTQGTGGENSNQPTEQR